MSKKRNKTRVLITGGAGFMGFHLATRLAKQGYSVDLIDNLSRGVLDNSLRNLLKSKKIKLYKLDLKKKIKIKIFSYKFIFHCAAILGVRNVINNPYKVINNNVSLLSNVLEYAQKQKNLKRFLFFSTSEVYGGSLKKGLLKFPTSENNLLCLDELNNPRSTYMLSKIYGEAMCHFSSIPFTILRPHNIFGERMGMSHVIPELTKKAKNHKKVFSVNNGNHKRAFCYIDDAINMILKIMNTQKTVGKTYNIGDPRFEIKIIKLAKKILKILNKNKKINFIEEKNYSPQKRLPDMKRLLKDISFKFNSSFNYNLDKTVKWYEKN
ncbi:MAG: NAD-binding protein [Pelagibacteraceae bacterium]|nr:NAD-binding protein [Pelagibacteraceae bacterium]|tara:strand:- start:15707 stop:16675 length:969 start_codon:yes stop_codon:yes gene_type:complete